jgi:uncharacterized protein (TIRG00374 family)
VFIVASLLGFGALFIITNDLSGSLSGFRHFDPRWALPALGLASMDWIGGGTRIWLLTRPLGVRLSYWKCIQMGGTTAAAAYLTPSGTGGGPTLIYGLVRNGVSLGRAVATNFASAIVNLVFLSLAGYGAWFFGAASAIEGITLPVANISAARLFEWSALGFATLGSLIILFAAAPRMPRLLLLRAFGRRRAVRKIVRVLQELHGSLIIYARKGKLALLLAMVGSMLQFGGRFVLGWCVLRGFGVDPGFWNVIVLHVLLQFLLYFMPTPGGTGVGEVLAPALMSPFLPERLLVAYTAVWRFFLTYLTVTLGGLTLFRWLAEDSRRFSAAPSGGTVAPGPNGAISGG